MLSVVSQRGRFDDLILIAPERKTMLGKNGNKVLTYSIRIVTLFYHLIFPEIVLLNPCLISYRRIYCFKFFGLQR